MSILNKNINSNMGSSSFHEFKKQASFFFKEKIKTARLALTDVTPAELLAEEATNENPWSPDARTLGSISRAAFEVDDYWRIVGILHKRFSKFERKNWRVSYNSLVVLERLLTHGPESVAEEFQSDKEVIEEMGSFQHIDERGFNWGLAVRKKAERILKLLGKGTLLKEERDRTRKLTRGIQGFGSFCQRSSANGILKQSSSGKIERCNSQFNNYENEENQIPPANGGDSIQKVEKIQQKNENSIPETSKNSKNSSSRRSFSDGKMLKNPETQTSFKENMAPNDEELYRWNLSGESNPLIDSRNEEARVGILVDDDHPFNGMENQATASLLSARDGILQGC
ncbi:ENTH domain-containing protein C794.11c-like [Pistacia vera]|uniref:ENTH domain-containing protein C794.11c-like n=1 Tax=Pistacia vera TaxID=55513 RepID=UPI0012638F36|nr:ENTH domain-containing protein C794.11c-like [Pistacia vera]XP_031287509.1 ENTH domain-containing protein C794.11c-like [Pistacia vera]